MNLKVCRAFSPWLRVFEHLADRSKNCLGVVATHFGELGINQN